MPARRRAARLGAIDPKPLTTNKLLAAAIKAKEAELAADEEVTDPETVNSKPKTVNVYEDADGRKWGFKSFAPKTLNINELVFVANFTDVRLGLGSTALNQKYYGFDGVTEAAV